MTTATPNPDDVDWAALSDIPEPKDVVNVRSLSDHDLLTRYHAITEDLKDLGQAWQLNPNSAGRELHSERVALRVEVVRRGLIT